MMVVDAGSVQNNQAEVRTYIRECKISLADFQPSQIEKCLADAGRPQAVMLVVQKRLREDKPSRDIFFRSTVKEGDAVLYRVQEHFKRHHPSLSLSTALEVRREWNTDQIVIKTVSLSPSAVSATPNKTVFTENLSLAKDSKKSMRLFVAGGLSQVQSLLYPQLSLGFQVLSKDIFVWGARFASHFSDRYNETFGISGTAGVRLESGLFLATPGLALGTVGTADGEFCLDAGAFVRAGFETSSVSPFLEISLGRVTRSASLGLEVPL